MYRNKLYSHSKVTKNWSAIIKDASIVWIPQVKIHENTEYKSINKGGVNNL